MDLHRQRASLLKIAIPVLLGTTWMFFAFVMDTRPADRPAGAIDRLARLPASLSTGQLPLAPQAKVAEPTRMDVLRVPCWDETQADEMAITARWVRVVGRACKTAGEVTVRNLANASVATVLPEAKGQLTTDFMPMENGRNELSFTFKSESGETLERRLTLVR